jgi:hypothetical protein
MKFWTIVALLFGSLIYTALNNEDELSRAITSNLQGMESHDPDAFAYVSQANQLSTDYEGVNLSLAREPAKIKTLADHNFDSIKTEKETLDVLNKPPLMHIEPKSEREKRAWHILDSVIANIPSHEGRCDEAKTLLSLRTAASKKDRNVSLSLAKQWIMYVQKEYCLPIQHTIKDMDFSPNYFPV